jgi:putative transposase
VELKGELKRIFEQFEAMIKSLPPDMVVKYLALDGHFGNHPSFRMVRRLNLHIITKLRFTSALYFEPTEEVRKAHPKKKYGDRVDYKGLPASLSIHREQDKDGVTEYYQAPCLHSDFSDKLNVVILVRRDLTGKYLSHVVLVSSDLELGGMDLVKKYRLRYQIEFAFRDGKQHFGLEDFMGVSKESVENGIGLPFLMRSLCAHLLEGLQKDRPEAGILDLKTLYRSKYYVEKALKLLADSPHGISCEEIVARMLDMLCIHPKTRPKAA